MERPFGIKVSVACELIIVIILVAVYLASSALLSMLGGIGQMAESPEPISIGGSEFKLADASPLDLLLTTTMYMALIVGLIHLVPAYLLWEGKRIGKYIATILAILNVPVVLIILDLFGFPFTLVALPLSAVILYFIWLDGPTKNYLAGGGPQVKPSR